LYTNKLPGHWAMRVAPSASGVRVGSGASESNALTNSYDVNKQKYPMSARDNEQLATVTRPAETFLCDTDVSSRSFSD